MSEDNQHHNETSLPEDFPFEKVSMTDVPDSVRNAFLTSVGLEEETIRIMGYDSLATLHHSNGDISYLGIAPNEIGEGINEENIFVIDVDQEGSLTGIGNIRFFREFVGMDDMVGCPFVGYTLTTGPKRQGLGTRRLFTMNTVALRIYGKPLYSGVHIEQDTARPLWDKLVTDGHAIKLPQNSEFAYRFK